ncbi:MAG: IS66 family transposase zinc-finger binding domain-containing protein [Candidatus Accumulibacter sp.]|uniref:IS66 family transposase zinc-finger binding domain-containing protein n=1 Tax=Candidatus Accumulibacter affinis TaxID=2954384 RepID=A0A935TB85_9PROT|nr:IS66 family transposase zinc-finger binding domain-containing protein [Candidatus Accumulibacter affinis]
MPPFSPSPELLFWAEKRVGGLLEQVKTSATEIHWRDAKIEKLTLELAYLRRMKFGVKSESLVAAERDLFDETLAADLAACEARLDEQRQAAEMGPHLPPAEKPKRERAGRQPLPEQLPRVEHLHEPETCTCGQCGQALVRIGEDVTEKLSIVPAEFFVERHLYPKYACRPWRDPHRRTGGGFGHRWRPGGAGLAGLGDGQQIRRSPAALSSGTAGRPLGGDAVSLDAGGLGRSHRCRSRTALAAPGRAAAPGYGAACR